MDEQTIQDDWAFGLRWLFVSAVGLLIGGVLAFSFFWGVGVFLERTLSETAAYAIGGGVFGAVMGLGASLGPGFLLQQRGVGVRAASWVVASVVAGALGMMLAMTLILSLMDPETLPEAITGALFGLSLGLPVGVGQSLALARHGVQASEWTLVNTVAFLAGMSAGIPLGGEGREWLALGVTGLVVGAITAPGMVWLLRQKAGSL